MSTSTAAESAFAVPGTPPTLFTPVMRQKKHLPSARVAASLPAVIVAAVPASQPAPAGTAGQVPPVGFAWNRVTLFDAMPDCVST